MKLLRALCILLAALLSGAVAAQESAMFSCPAGTADMKYFVISKSRRSQHYLAGSTNSVYTQVFPNEDFAPQGYWFWSKSPKAHGFDVKVFDRDRVYMRATELIWTDNTTFKRFTRDLPIAERCVPEGQPGAEIRVDLERGQPTTVLSGSRHSSWSLSTPAISASRSRALPRT